MITAKYLTVCVSFFSDALALSLNGTDPLLGQGLALSELGVVASDLLTVLTGDVALAALLQR